MSLPTILITGGAGYIGSHTALLLSQSGYRPLIVDNGSHSDPLNIAHLELLMGEPLLFIEGDIHNTSLIRALLYDYQCEGVIHFAGLKSVNESFTFPDSYYHHNLVGSLELLHAMADSPVKTFLFSSSAAVYGATESLPITEGFSCHPESPYGRTKRMVEEMLGDFQSLHRERQTILLRYFNPVGAHPSGLLGERLYDAPNNLMPYITKVASGKQPSLAIFGNDYPTPDGTAIRDYLHVSDLAEGHLAALVWGLKQATTKKEPPLEVINLGTGKGYSVLEVVAAFEKNCGIVVPYHVAPRRLGDMAACWADVTKAEQLLSWKAKRSLEEMCYDSWEREKKRTAL